jgi:16S rRNA (guanine527-N7)-methyltransferase
MNRDSHTIWQEFADEFTLSKAQIDAFKTYYHELVRWNNNINLTRIVDEHDVVAYHFMDSLQLGDFYDFAVCNSVADVGTGAGMPGIPLKIRYPHISVVLIEVVQKKVAFLEHIIRTLGLKDIVVCPIDWRTFLRTTDYQIDLISARASLRPDELVRAFKPQSAYKNSTIVYWAKSSWEPSGSVAHMVSGQINYHIGSKQHAYVFLKN